jgi:glucose uptake protein GlcU
MLKYLILLIPVLCWGQVYVIVDSLEIESDKPDTVAMLGV